MLDMNTTQRTRRTATIIISAARGNVRASRALVSRAIRAALKIRKWGTGDHMVAYMTSADVREYSQNATEPRFQLEATTEEMQRVTAAIEILAEHDGWNQTPVDIYHD
jgi:hypothetical protein